MVRRKAGRKRTFPGRHLAARPILSIAGERNPKGLAQLARARARRKITELEAALEGAEFVTPAHAAPLATMLARIDQLNTGIGGLTEVIEPLLAPHEEQLAQAESMPGWGRRAAQDALAETGVDMSRFHTPAHLASWAGRTPLDNQSGKRTGRAKSKKGNRYLAGLLGETAVAAGKTQTREGDRYRPLTRRRGKLKAQVALGNTQLKVYHKLLSHPGTRYQDLGPDYYERQATTRRQIAHHISKLAALGFEVTLARTPGPAGSASNAAALMPVPVALAGLLLIGCASRMPARTAKGASLARQEEAAGAAADHGDTRRSRPPDRSLSPERCRTPSHPWL